jgi:transcriptional regulator with XRE-family HTH domain
MDKIGAMIFAVRKVKGLTQQELADLSDIPKPYISYIETGRWNPKPEHLAKLEEALNVNFDEVRPAFEHFTATVHRQEAN